MEAFEEVALLPAAPEPIADCPRTGRVFVGLGVGRGLALSRDSFSPIAEVCDDSASSGDVLFDPQFLGDNYLASRSTSGALLVWDLRDGGLIARYPHRPWSSGGPYGHWVEQEDRQLVVRRLLPGPGDPILRVLTLSRPDRHEAQVRITTGRCGQWIATAVVVEEDGSWLYDVRAGVTSLEPVYTEPLRRPIVADRVPMSDLDGIDENLLYMVGPRLRLVWDVHTRRAWDLPFGGYVGDGWFVVRRSGELLLHRLGGRTWRIPAQGDASGRRVAALVGGSVAVAGEDGRLEMFAIP